MVAARLSARH